MDRVTLDRITVVVEEAHVPDRFGIVEVDHDGNLFTTFRANTVLSMRVRSKQGNSASSCVAFIGLLFLRQRFQSIIGDHNVDARRELELFLNRWKHLFDKKMR